MGRRKFDHVHEAYAVREKLLALVGDPQGFAKVPDIFAALKFKPAECCDIFWVLDETPGRFGAPVSSWHSVLRQCRNHPVHGADLFRVFNGTYIPSSPTPPQPAAST